MALTIRYNGVNYTNFTKASVVLGMDKIARGFSFSTSPDIENKLPIKRGDNVSILADGQLLVAGVIETMRINYSISDHSIDVIGRSNLKDLVDSSVGVTKDFKGVGFAQVCRTVLDDLGMTDIKIINEIEIFAPDIPNSNWTEFDIVKKKTVLSNVVNESAEIGQKAADFLQRIANKLQVILTSNNKSDLVITENKQRLFKNVVLQHKEGNGRSANDIKTAAFSNSDENRFHTYRVLTQESPTTSFSIDKFLEDSFKTPKELTSQNGTAIDKEIKSTRLLEIRAKEDTISGTANEQAKWEANKRRNEGFQYTVTVFGHTINGHLWLPNYLVRVIDDKCNIKAPLLIKSVRYNYSFGGGSECTLELAYSNAFTTEVNIPVSSIYFFSDPDRTDKFKI